MQYKITRVVNAPKLHGTLLSMLHAQDPITARRTAQHRWVCMPCPATTLQRRVSVWGYPVSTVCFSALVPGLSDAHMCREMLGALESEWVSPRVFCIHVSLHTQYLLHPRAFGLNPSCSSYHDKCRCLLAFFHENEAETDKEVGRSVNHLYKTPFALV